MKGDKKMVHKIVGVVAIILGAWLLANHWWAFLDLLWVVFPCMLISFGVIALVVGFSRKKK